MKVVIKILWALRILRGGNLLRVIQQLVNKHNGMVEPKNQVVIKSPVIHTLTSRSNISAKLMNEEPLFFKNMKAEKAYDLRHNLIDEIWNAGEIRYSEEVKDNELTLKIELHVYEQEKN